MLDLDNTSVCEECAMMCMELQYEDADKDIVVYRDQGINTEEFEKAMYGDLTKPKVKKRKKLSTMWPKAQMTVCYWKGKGDESTKLFLMKKHTVLVRVTPQ